MYEVGHEVLCVNNKSQRSLLTEGKIYVVLNNDQDEEMIGVTSDHGSYNTFFSNRFIPNTPEAKAKYMRKKLEDTA